MFDRGTQYYSYEYQRLLRSEILFTVCTVKGSMEK